jgi:hypothetical protein
LDGSFRQGHKHAGRREYGRFPGRAGYVVRRITHSKKRDAKILYAVPDENADQKVNINHTPTSTASVREILGDFAKVAILAGADINLEDIKVEELNAPHQKPASLPAGMVAVYIFIYGEQCLKVGKAGAKSAARYCSQHYGLHAPSTLAKSLIKHQSRLGLSGIDELNVGRWICQNTTRVNLLFQAIHGPAVLSLLEAFVQCRLNPAFEGFESQRLSGAGLPMHAQRLLGGVGALFAPEPEVWGLRGDPFLWRQMRSDLLSTPLPATEADLESLIAKAFLDTAGQPISSDEDVYVQRYSRGGMSSGFVSPEFWRDQAMALLKKRFVERKSLLALGDEGNLSSPSI